ncbi:hypothetical protein ACIOZM_01340 [Pseudomonas sp. NPDC087346]|uniref:hypothetical protein n=1 Tax=Pseudomonas sp. NPDC087346 TaxID=3364438 RepID=UPI00381AF9EE
MKWIIFTIALLFRPALADTQNNLLDCSLSDGSTASLLACPSNYGQRLFLKIDDHVDTAFTDMPDSDFVGEVVLAKCTASTLIYAMNYGSPYLKGAVLRKSPITGTLERIDFAEKAQPTFLYLRPQQMRLVIPNEGYEDPSKLLIYDYLPKKGQPDEPKGANALPNRKGFEVIDLK